MRRCYQDQYKKIVFKGRELFLKGPSFIFDVIQLAEKVENLEPEKGQKIKYNRSDFFKDLQTTEKKLIVSFLKYKENFDRLVGTRPSEKEERAILKFEIVLGSVRNIINFSFHEDMDLIENNKLLHLMEMLDNCSEEINQYLTNYKTRMLS